MLSTSTHASGSIRMTTQFPSSSGQAQRVSRRNTPRAAAPQAAVYVVNNNSSDRTAAIVESAAQEDANLFLLHEKRQGKSEAIRFAFQHVDADVYVMVDADSTYHASNLPELLP